MLEPPTPKNIFPIRRDMNIVRANLAPTPFLFRLVCISSLLNKRRTSVSKPTCFHSSSLISSCLETPKESSSSSFPDGTIAGGMFRSSLQKNPVVCIQGKHVHARDVKL